MAITSCLPVLVPLLSLYLVNTSMLTEYVPGPMKKIAILGVIYLLTYIVAKINCWDQDIYVSLRAIAPVCIFIGWLILHYIPITGPFMYTLGDNVFVIIVLSLIYKMIYDAERVFGVCSS